MISEPVAQSVHPPEVPPCARGDSQELPNPTSPVDTVQRGNCCSCCGSGYHSQIGGVSNTLRFSTGLTL